MIKLLIINSDALYEHHRNYYIDNNTGVFIDDLSKQNIKISLFHFAKKKSIETISNFKIDENRISVFSVKRNNFKIFSHIKALLFLFKIIRKIDFLYLFYPNAFFYSVFLAICLRKPFGLYLRGEKKIKSIISTFLFRKAKFVVSISPQFTTFVQEKGGKGFTIKPMINFDLEEVPIRTYKEFSETFNLLFVGRIERDKGVFELIKSVKMLQQTTRNFKLYLLGNGKNFKEVQKLISSEKLENHVILMGGITEKALLDNYYKTADIFILPTHHEGFPRVLYEAMIFKVPIVTTFVGSIPYLMKDNFNCLKIEVENPECINYKLIHLINNPESRKKIVDNATDTVRNYLETYKTTHSEFLIENL